MTQRAEEVNGSGKGWRERGDERTETDGREGVKQRREVIRKDGLGREETGENVGGGQEWNQ